MNLNLLISQFNTLFKKFNNYQNNCFILSASDLQSQAVVVHKYITDESKDINEAILELNNKLIENNIYPIIFKIDQITNKQELTYLELKNLLINYKSGYFRKGIIFDTLNKFVLLESELNSNEILINNEINFKNNYFKIRFNGSVPNITDNNLVYIFDTKSYISYDDQVFEIDDTTKYRKITNKSNINLLKRVLRLLGNYLILNIQNNGQFRYLYLPVNDKYKLKYNVLRHLGTTWSLLKLYQYFNWVDYKVTVYNAIKFIIANFVETRVISDVKISFIKSDGLINLGATALCSLVLIDFYQIFKEKTYNVLLDQLILGLAYLQNEDGSFNHTLNINDLSVNSKFVIIYYHDEALFALTKYYKLNNNDAILDVIKNGLKYCIDNKTDTYMDHWLSYTLNEFIDIDDLLKYLKLGINNFNPFLKKMYTADTIYNVLLELLCQSKIMLGKASDLNLEYNKEMFNKTLVKRAEIQLDGFGWPEIAMYFKRPDLVLNSIFIRHKHFRIRIDDLQHTILGLLSYIQILETKIL